MLGCTAWREGPGPMPPIAMRIHMAITAVAVYPQVLMLLAAVVEQEQPALTVMVARELLPRETEVMVERLIYLAAGSFMEAVEAEEHGIHRTSVVWVGVVAGVAEGPALF